MFIIVFRKQNKYLQKKTCKINKMRPNSLFLLKCPKILEFNHVELWHRPKKDIATKVQTQLETVPSVL